MGQDLASPAATPTGQKQLGGIDIIFLGSKIIEDGDCKHEIKKVLSPWKKSYDKPREHIKKQRLLFADKGLQSKLKSYGFSSSHVWM